MVASMHVPGHRTAATSLAVIALLWLVVPARGVPPDSSVPLARGTGTLVPASPGTGFPLSREMWDDPQQEFSAGQTSPSAEPVCEIPTPAIGPGLPPSGASCGSGPAGPHAIQERWLYRPFSAGWFLGMAQGSALMDDWVRMNEGFLGGFRMGWDLNDAWGLETRFAFSGLQLDDSDRARRAQEEADARAGYPDGSSLRRRFDTCRDADLFQWDVDVLYYPWGDSAWRPYLMTGLGLTSARFMDRLSDARHYVGFSLPLGVGVKYRWTDWLALRLECVDDIAFGRDEIETFHALAFNLGLEIRFGGTRRVYWPWNPGRHYW